ncbi:MAG: glycosyltransferase [Opitutales bacterium]|nr:glycosyltransferase [Opitutales bacterium]
MSDLLEYPKISLVVPTFNSEKYLDETLRSIVDQKYPNLELIVVDGKSEDSTLDIVAEYQANIALLISEVDEGPYDAINKGFSASTGELMGWLNADDSLLPKSLFLVGSLFRNLVDVHWITGVPSKMDARGIIFKSSLRRLWKRSNLLEFEKGIPQQESTFWRRSIWEKSGGKLDTSAGIAADYELWCRFFKFTDLVSVNAYLGSFRKHLTNWSIREKEAYLENCETIRKKYLDEYARLFERKWILKESVREVFYNFEKKEYKVFHRSGTGLFKKYL